MQRIHREPLEQCNLDRLLVISMHHAGSLAQHLHGTRPGATRAQNIRIEDGASRTGKVSTGNFFDEARHIDMRRARHGARRVKTIETSICFGHSSLPVERRMKYPG